MKAFEYQLERIKSTVTYEKYKISRNEDLEKYIGELTECDDSLSIEVRYLLSLSMITENICF